LQITSSCSSRH